MFTQYTYKNRTNFEFNNKYENLLKAIASTFQQFVNRYMILMNEFILLLQNENRDRDTTNFMNEFSYECIKKVDIEFSVWKWEEVRAHGKKVNTFHDFMGK